MKSKRCRSLQDMRTMSNRAGQTDSPQRKYLALAMLELERTRRTGEKQIASQRVQDADCRLAEIEKEQASLLAAAEAELAASSLAAGSGSQADPGCQGGQGFELAY